VSSIVTTPQKLFLFINILLPLPGFRRFQFEQFTIVFRGFEELEISVLTPSAERKYSTVPAGTPFFKESKKL
jgi:hypothetical protein